MGSRGPLQQGSWDCFRDVGEVEEFSTGCGSTQGWTRHRPPWPSGQWDKVGELLRERVGAAGKGRSTEAVCPPTSFTATADPWPSSRPSVSVVPLFLANPNQKPPGRGPSVHWRHVQALGRAEEGKDESGGKWRTASTTGPQAPHCPPGLGLLPALHQGLLASPQTTPPQCVQNQDSLKGSLRPCCVCDHHPAHPEQVSTSTLRLLLARWFIPFPGLPRPAGAPAPRLPSAG